MTTEETPIQIAINKLGDFWETEQDFRMTEYIHIHEILVGLLLTEKQIADDFAIGFAEWTSYKYKYLETKGWFGNSYDLEMGIFKSSKQLLEIYKKEKGL